MGTMPTALPGASRAQVPRVAAVPPPAPTGGSRVLASAYDGAGEGNACPGFPRTRRGTLSVRTNLVPCGARLRICLDERCVVAQRRDTGALTGGSRIVLNTGVVLALGVRSVQDWDVRTVQWEPVRGTSGPGASNRHGWPAAAAVIPAVLPTRITLATAYSAWDEGNACPGFPQTRMMDLTVGSDLVPCGTYIRICLTSGKRCVVAQRRDWGPFTGGRHIDMNLGVVRALGYTSLYHWGVREVRWGLATNPARAGASTPR